MILSFDAAFYKEVKKKKDNSLLFIVNHVFDMQILRSRFWSPEYSKIFIWLMISAASGLPKVGQKGGGGMIK